MLCFFIVIEAVASLVNLNEWHFDKKVLSLAVSSSGSIAIKILSDRLSFETTN